MSDKVSFRSALRGGSILLGSWLQIRSASSAEIVAATGFDWVAVDCEHTDIALETSIDLIRVLCASGVVPLVRVASNDTIAIRQALDGGAQGVIVPLVSSATDAQVAVRAARYPPAGVRGFAFCRANGWGRNFDERVREANESVAVIVMVETRQAVDNVDAILGVDGVDGVFLGPYDLSGSYGVPGNTSDPLVVTARMRVMEACRAHGKAAGIHVVLPTEASVASALEEGYSFLAVGMDTVFLRLAADRAFGIAQECRTGRHR